MNTQNNNSGWARICPKCGSKRNYATWSGFRRAQKHNKPCKACLTTSNKRTTVNHVGEKFGKLTITKQYYLEHGPLRVDYECKCGNKTEGKTFSKVRIQKMCSVCRKTNAHKIKDGTSFNMLFADYKRHASARNLEFFLSKETFSELTKKTCFYCGSNPSAIKRPDAVGGSYVYNGVDRKDNARGYTEENCVPCCKICNFAKHELTTDDLLN